MHPSLLPRLPVAPKTGAEPIEGAPTPTTLLDFWKWWASDLLDNGIRSGIAEFIVAMAVGDTRPVRESWASHDVTSKDGPRVEVKATCAVQSWAQKRPSKPIFTVRPTRAWSPETGKYGEAALHNSDVFVFAVLVAHGSDVPNPLDVRQWRFYVLSTTVLSELASKVKTVGLETVRKWGAVEVGFEGLGEAVRGAAVSRSE